MVFSFTATGNSLYAAKHFSDAPEFTARLAAEAGIRADYVSAIQMVDNYLPVFDMDEQRALDKRVEEQLSAAVQAVSRGQLLFGGRQGKAPEEHLRILPGLRPKLPAEGHRPASCG